MVPLETPSPAPGRRGSLCGETTTVSHESSTPFEGERKGETYSSDLSAVSDATGGSQVTTAVSFPGSAAFSLDGGHLILGGSISEINGRLLRRKEVY